jgi:hypothetical protein
LLSVLLKSRSCNGCFFEESVDFTLRHQNQHNQSIMKPKVHEHQKNSFKPVSKTIYLLAALILCGTAAFSQVGINTSTPNAALDIRSANQAAPSNTDGLLIPKVDAFPAVNPTAAQQGMMVYLTTTSGANTPGFYYWDDASTAWITIGGSGKGWDLNGNTGTNPATNYIGTTDAQALALKTNNAERIRIDAGGSVGIGTATPQNKLHVFTGASGMTPNPFSVATLESTTSSYLSVLSGGETGVLFGANGNSTNGAIVYNNPGLADGMLFRTAGNINRMVIGPTGNIGLGNFIPSYPLHFQSAVGDKIALFGGVGVHYGIGIQNNLLQIHADGAGSDIAFGYGTSAAMTETMRVKGNGRVGIGLGLPNSRLEIAATNMATPANTDGLIIPRINAFPVANPAAAQNGMLVFLTTTVGAFQPGFYYWNNATTSWKGIGSSGTPNDWGLAGNTGTSPATNFIGTGDDNDFIFKRNNVRAGIIGTTNTSFGKGSLNPVTTGANNTAIGSNALLADTTGFRNTAIGSSAMASALGGSYNTAVGTSALANSTSGGSNTAIGDASMVGLIGGTFNVGVGNNTLTANTEGDGNTALGHRAMFANTLGNQNTAVGMNALYNNQASGIVGVGIEALAANTTGIYNTATGSYALHANSLGGYNTATGYQALYNNVGSYNTATGVNSGVTNTSGAQNVSMGYQSLYLNTTGSYITALGMNALYSNQTASSLTAVGHNSLFSNTTGINNNALGANALYKNTTGSNNTGMGTSALYWNNGDYNTAFGSSSLANNLAGYDNSASGAFSLVSNTNGYRNTAQGGASLFTNNTGHNNTASGYFSLYSNQTGSDNTAIGVYALQDNNTGNDNTAIGREALKATTVSGGVAVGAQALLSNVSGNYNTGVGTNSLRANVSGSYNTASGYNALLNTTGDYNTANGVNALLTNTTGHSNTSIGYRSLYNNDAASFNTAVGDAAMYENISGTSNSVLGHHALRANTSGSNNVVAGVNAVYNNPAGSDNTSLGTSSMASMIAGSGNTAIGSGAMVSQGTGDNNIAIGKNAALPQALGSNQLSIGNVIYGSGMDVTATAKIGVGKATPDAKLDIAASNAAAPANTDGLLIPRVNGFPAANPTAAQNGMMIYLTTTIGFYPAGFYYWDNTAVSWVGVGTKNNWSTSGNAGINPAVQYMGTSDNNDVSLRANGTEAMRLEVGGNVGIGTNNPTTKLEVNGFTKLGTNAPAIKTLKLTGTTNASQGVQTPVLHGISSSKILSVSVLVEYAAGAIVPANYSGSVGYEFDYFINSTSITVWTKSGNSANILSKPFRILVTYEE